MTERVPSVAINAKYMVSLPPAPLVTVGVKEPDKYALMFDGVMVSDGVETVYCFDWYVIVTLIVSPSYPDEP